MSSHPPLTLNRKIFFMKTSRSNSMTSVHTMTHTQKIKIKIKMTQATYNFYTLHPKYTKYFFKEIQSTLFEEPSSNHITPSYKKNTLIRSLSIPRSNAKFFNKMEMGARKNYWYYWLITKTEYTHQKHEVGGKNE